MSKKIFDSVLSKLGELITDGAYDTVAGIIDFKSNLKTLQKSSKLLSAKATDVEVEVNTAERSGQKKRKREIEEWLIDVKTIGIEVLEYLDGVEQSGFIRKFFSGGKATRLNEEVEKLVEQSQHFGELLLDVCGTMGVTLPTTSMFGGTFERNLKRICELLESGQVSCIGVHGMGGVGKTTLAMHVNNRILEHCHGRVFWVTVSHEFTIKSLQDKIAHSLGVKHLLDEDDEVIIRAAKLRRALCEMKNSVLILDDVWEYVDLLKLGCPVSKECCRLVITTRSLEVCDQIGCEEKVAVQKLDEEEAWKLFSETLGKEIKLAPRVEEIAKSMAKLCGGLPLGIVTLAGSMRGETAIHTWRNSVEVLKESMAGQDGMREVEVFKVLKYSFDRLNKYDESESTEEFNMFQLCFLYFSLYPEDHKIPRNELIRKLISEGLLERRKSRREQVDQGHVIVDKLVNVCLLESCVESYEDIECVKMHDLVRGMALQIGGGKYMVRAGNYSWKEIPKDEEWTENLEKVSLMYNDLRFIEDGTSPNCPNLSTLLLQKNFNLEFIPDSFFTKMQGLCSLDLSGTRIEMLPNSVSELKSLKALLLENCGMLESVPYLGNLKALRELNLDNTAIKVVPEGVEELLNLKLLWIDSPLLEMPPEGFLVKLVRLQHVKFPFHVRVPLQGIENLKQVERFWGRLKNVRDFNSFIRSRERYTSYTIRVGSVSESKIRERWPGFKLLNQKAVTLTECTLTYEKVLLEHDIELLSVSECEGLSNCFLDEFLPSNFPKSLKELKIKRCGGIECIVRSEQELVSQFSTLEDLELSMLEDLKGVTILKAAAGEIGPQAVFSSLRRLHIYGCNKMRKLGLPAFGFPNLEAIKIEWCNEMEEIFEDEGRGSDVGLPRLRVLGLYKLPSLKSVCKATIICNSIETIWMVECPRLMSVCKATIICNSIQEISIVGCPRLMKKLPLHMDDPPPPSLREIRVEREWWESLEWDNPNLPTLLQPLVQFYRSPLVCN